ncbi:hypothetical protein FHX37_2784 [Haloactinospora alba]|uniref:Phytase-like domain-containing protein n=1 Tax=Haloactinospora alba TaxID=405555 RepID=A0A543NLU2_9ACTN|nr:esterase-like activity of phytase family protein [Haloactinospora alba]TQN32801.1 hypothetical protein FHX37_2784 [Haloactinospora alba]
MPAPTRLAAAGALALSLTAAPQPASAEPAGDSPVRLLGSATVPHGTTVAGTTVGGLSGIDRDPATGRYLLLSDDRSRHDPARFYTADIDVSRDAPPEVDITGVRTLRAEDGSPYPPLGEFAASGCASPDARCAREGTVDPEEVRVGPRGRVWWTTEGERSAEPRVRLHPQVRVADRDGTTTRRLPVPHLLRMSPAQRGPRANLTLEGMDLTPGGDVVTAMEGPLLQDGAVPTPEEGAVARFTRTSGDGTVRAQYGYPVDPVPAAPDPAGGAADNGVSALLADPARPGEYLVVERAYVSGVGNDIRVYRADTTRAADIAGVPALEWGHRDPRLVEKTLLADLGDTGLEHVDNVEGATWGPRLPGGERTLLLVTDDNFSTNQETQVIALAVG